jgi:hypothetical protein
MGEAEPRFAGGYDAVTTVGRYAVLSSLRRQRRRVENETKWWCSAEKHEADARYAAGGKDDRLVPVAAVRTEGWVFGVAPRPCYWAVGA